MTNGAALAARFEFESELRADALRIAHATASQVRHQQRALARRRVDDLAYLAATRRHSLRDLRQFDRFDRRALMLLRRDGHGLRRREQRGRDRVGELSGGRFRVRAVVRHHVEVRKNLIRDLAEDRRGHVASVVRAHGFVHDDDDDSRRVLDRREADERSDVLRLRIRVRLRVNLLRRAGLARGGVALQLRRARRSFQRYHLKHPAQLARRLRAHNAVRFGPRLLDDMALRVAHLSNKVRRDAHAVVRNRRVGRGHLHGRDADLLPDRNGAD